MTSERFGEAYQQGFELTVRFLISRGLERENAKEVAQAAWVRGWERLTQLRDEALIVTWVNTIALNLYRGVKRREPRNLNVWDLYEPTVVIDVGAIDIKRVLGFCRPQDRALLEQCLSGASMAEIASQQGISETAARIRALRARRFARCRVERRSLTLRRSRLLLLARRKAA